MSHNYYNELWLITRNDVEKLLMLDRRVQEQPRTKDRAEGLSILLPTYLRYRNMVKRLIVCHDQMVQTQKRDMIKRVLDCAVGRMLDYKKRIVNLNYSDYQWPDDFMKQLKYTPDDVEITVSATGKDLVQQRRKRFEEMMANAYKCTWCTVASFAEMMAKNETAVNIYIRGTTLGMIVGPTLAAIVGPTKKIATFLTVGQRRLQRGPNEIPTINATRVKLSGGNMYRKKLFRMMTLTTYFNVIKIVPEKEEQISLAESVSVVASEGSGSKVRRRRVKEESAMTVVPSILQISPEEMAAREARLAAQETMKRAIMLMQSHERARVARVAATDQERMGVYRRKLELGEIVPKKLPRETFEKAARTIQRAWWRYLRRKKQEKRMNRLEELIGMSIPCRKSDHVLAKDRENFQKKLDLMPEYAKRVQEATQDLRTKLWKIRGPGLMEDITEEIREWFIVWYNELGQFDAYPAASLGGTVLVITEETMTPQEFLAQKRVKKSDAKDKKEKGKKKKKKKETWMPETQAFTRLDTANQDFIADWSFRDDSEDLRQKIYDDLIKNNLCYELQLEMRKIVDELMRLELNRLNKALKKDCKADGREAEIPKSKAGKKKKVGWKKGKKGKSGKFTAEEGFNELVQANIIASYPTTSLKDWVGDLSYQNYEAAREFREYGHRLGEIRQVVMENCVLPLSSKEIHEIAPLVRSACICGLPGDGKTFLVNAICSEVGALLINMTPTVLVDKYTGRKNERKLMDIISKVAREFAPTVIFIENGEKPWAKKVPVEEKFIKPKRFAKYYLKFVKSIKRGDQILFLTTSSEPYKATRPFVRVHDKFIMIPLTDYNTLYMFYKDLLMRYHGVDRGIDVSCLAKLSAGIPLDFIKQSVENVLNVHRRITLRFNPLNQQEIIEELLKYVPPGKKELKQYAKFVSRTPLERKRVRLLKAEKAEREKAKKTKKTKK